MPYMITCRVDGRPCHVLSTIPESDDGDKIWEAFKARQGSEFNPRFAYEVRNSKGQVFDLDSYGWAKKYDI